jgi:AhpD family alkylhydroperoxidase
MKTLDPRAAAVFADIRATRQTDYVNNFWHALAAHPALLEETWAQVKAVMAPGTLDPLIKEMLYVAVSVTNHCNYCIASHSAAARKAGMTEEQFGELLAVVALANATNRLASALQVPVDDRFKHIQE